MSDQELGIIFIGGTGRCGTNITKTALSKHEDIGSLPFEYRFSIDPLFLVETYLGLKNSWSPYSANVKVNQLRKSLFQIGNRSHLNFILGRIIKFIDPSGKKITPPPYFEWEMSKWFPNYFLHVERLLENLIEFDYNAYWPGEKLFRLSNRMSFVSYDSQITLHFRDFFRAIIKDFLTSQKKFVFVEDNTWNLLYAETLIEILPEAKFIHVVRDPRDVVCSMLNQRWCPNDIDQACIYYSSLMTRILVSKGRMASGTLIEFKMEDLISKDRKLINTINKFTGLDHRLGILNTDYSYNSVGRWRRDLNAEDQAKLNSYLDDYVTRLGYMIDM